jgi:ankyrin repeat protein
MNGNDKDNSTENNHPAHSESRHSSGLEFNAKIQSPHSSSSPSKHQKKLFTLIEKNKFEELQEFVAKYPHCINFLDPDNNSTPLHKAVLYGNSNIVSTLLKVGASVNSFDRRGIISSNLYHEQIYF